MPESDKEWFAKRGAICLIPAIGLTYVVAAGEWEPLVVGALLFSWVFSIYGITSLILMAKKKDESSTSS
jgi:hypothetical protein